MFFTPVCESIHRGMSAPLHAAMSRPRSRADQPPPLPDTMGCGQQAGSTHPT